MSQLVLLREVDGVVYVDLNRAPKRNALTRELLQELLLSLKSLAVREEIRALVWGRHSPWFCAGMDLAQMQETAALAEAKTIWDADTQLYREIVETVFHFPFPTLAVVRGAALAGGLGLALACDLTLAAASAVFALPEPKRGITAAIVTPLLVYRVGSGQAAYLLLSGRNVPAAEAQSRGLCHVVAADDQVEQTTDQFVQSILSGAPGALRVTKQQLRHCAPFPLSDRMIEAARASSQIRSSEEAREGLAAFLEKRPPRWQPQDLPGVG
jgi:methylglutaconyl-CoA hydratase